MRKIFFLAVLTSLIQISCKKDSSLRPAPTSLDGTWKMIIVKENASGLITTKPASVQKDIELTFTSSGTTNGTFNGHTPANLIDNSPFSTGPNQSISINFLMMTKVGEEPWGSLFVDNITKAQGYSFGAGNLLNIHTVNKTLTFKQL